jgi:hypothetical protein
LFVGGNPDPAPAPGDNSIVRNRNGEQNADMQASIDPQQLAKFAEFLPGLGSVRPFDFHSTGAGVLFPELNQPGALESFFFNAAHQFGFWYLEDDRYARPMIAPAGGVMRKGSDYLSYCVQRALNADPEFYTPARLAKLSDDACAAIFHDDHGVNPLPMWREHLEIMRGYARWFLDHHTSPQEVLDGSNTNRKPLNALLAQLHVIPGYAEDPLQKKSMLLATILENRPEKFLRVTDPQSATPIVDYHIQRSALRTGLVRIDDAGLRRKLESRARVDEHEEQAIRQATYEAVGQLIKQSGLSAAAIDYFFFTNRTKCPEMTEPECDKCPVQEICARHKSLFQPVFRTTAY